MASIENTSNGESKMVIKFPIPFIPTSPLLLQQAPLLFSQQFLKPIHFLNNFHKDITSNAHKYLKLLHFSTTHHPFVQKILSFSSHLHNFSQAQYRIARNVNPLSNHNFAAVLPGDSVAGVVVANGILNFLNLYNTLLVVRLVLTWFPNTPPQIVSPLSTICDPYLNIFRGIIPPLGGTLDLSPILAFLVLNAFTSAASALPAELPSSQVSDGGSSLAPTSQEKWRRRLMGSKTSNPNGTT